MQSLTDLRDHNHAMAVNQTPKLLRLRLWRCLQGSMLLCLISIEISTYQRYLVSLTWQSQRKWRSKNWSILSNGYRWAILICTLNGGTYNSLEIKMFWINSHRQPVAWSPPSHATE